MTQDKDFIKIENNTIIVQNQDLWSNKGHTFGDGMFSPDKKYFYLSISKNSSSSIKNNLLNLGWEFSNIKYHPGIQIIVVLRDPIDRWICGIYEYLLMYHIDTIDLLCEPYNYNMWPLIGEKLGLSLLFDRITFDDHTERQCMFLQNVKFDQCTWLLVNDNFSQNFEELLNNIGYVNTFTYSDKENSSGGQKGTLGYKKNLFKNLFQYIIDNNTKHATRLKNWFWCDYKLINSVKFYGSR